MATIPETILIRQIQMRRDTLANWELYNPILADGEFGVVRSTDPLAPTSSQFKIGDGATHWLDLEYAGLSGPPGEPGALVLSPQPSNRAQYDTEDDNSLYVPELSVDLSQIYVQTLSGQVVDTTTLAPSEKALANYVIAATQDTLESRSELTSVAKIPKTAGETLSALVCVYERDGVVKKLDYRDSENIHYLLGITVTAAASGSTVMVQRIGQISDDWWSLTVGRIYLGVNGAISNTAPTTGYDVLLGMATTPKSITLNIQDPIELG